MIFPAKAVALLAAWLFLVVTRSKEILIAVKSHDERTRYERRMVERGMIKSLVLDALLFVPASVSLLLWLAPVIVGRFHMPEYPAYALIGIISYEFPFRSIQRIITRVALAALREAHTEIVKGEADIDA